METARIAQQLKKNHRHNSLITDIYLAYLQVVNDIKAKSAGFSLLEIFVNLLREKDKKYIIRFHCWQAYKLYSKHDFGR